MRRRLRAGRRESKSKREREAKLQALFASVPVLFRTDFMVSKLGKAACSRTPRPQGSSCHVRTKFRPSRASLQHLMAADEGAGMAAETWRLCTDRMAQLVISRRTRPSSAPLRQLSEKSSPSEDEVSLAIDRAQATLLNEFAQVCAEIRGHYPDGLPRFIVLPSFTTPRAMAAEWHVHARPAKPAALRPSHRRPRAAAVNATRNRSPGRPMSSIGGRSEFVVGVPRPARRAREPGNA